MNTAFYNKNNFHNHTFCIFKEVSIQTITNLKLHYKSKSGSSYYFVEEGVYRLSNHWGRAANCRWRLVTTTTQQKVNNDSQAKLGFAKWTDFHRDNEVEKLYFIAANYVEQTVQFFHKENENYTPTAILRTATETAKHIKQIRILFHETSWANYLKESNIAILRKEIIQKLIESEISFQEIRREYL